MSEWQETTVDDLAPFSYGKGLPEAKRKANGQIPVYGSNGIVGFHDTPLTSGPTIIIGRKGSIGNVHFSPIPCWPIDTTFYVTGSDPSLIRHRYYLLSSVGFNHMNTDSAVPGLNRDAAHARLIHSPKDENEQRAIAHILGTLDDKIELNRRMNETLEGIARALFKSWFIDFDPVRAKAEGRQPFGMDEGTAELFPDQFEDSELGEIPKGWVAGNLGDEFSITMGQSPPGKSYNEDGEGIEFYQGRTDFGARYPKPRVYCTAPNRYANPGDTLVSVRAPVGDINIAHHMCCIGRGLAAVIHKSGRQSYTFCTMNSLHDSFKQFESEGTVFGCIGKDGFNSIKVVIPPDEVIAKFESLLSPVDLLIFVNHENSNNLERMRNILLPKLISGDIRIDASKFGFGQEGEKVGEV